jgi:hypothetical protein
MSIAGRSTRRQLLAGGLGAATGLAALASSAQADTAGPGSSLPSWVQDGKVLQQLLQAERTLEYGCQAVLGSHKLKQASQDEVFLLLAHDQAHVVALQAHLRALHLPQANSQPQHPAPFPPREIADLFKHIKHEKDALQGLVQIMNLAQYSYFSAVGSFHDLRLVRLAAEILANLAQHWTILEDLLHRGDATLAVPHPYDRGSLRISKPHIT